MTDTDDKSVLLIDDQSFFISAIEPILEEWGYEVVSCTDPLDAVKAFKAKDFSVVLCDLHMPCLRGDKLLFQFNQINPKQKCCLMTACELDDPLLKKTLTMANVHGFIKKPIGYDNLAKVLDKFSDS